MKTLAVTSLEVVSSSPLEDALRIMFVFVPASLVVGYVTLVLLAYYKAYRVERFKSARAGLLPHHVWTISISYLLLIIDAVLGVYERRGDDLSIHSFLLVPAFVTGILAMRTVLSYERIRHRSAIQVNSDMDEYDDFS